LQKYNRSVLKLQLEVVNTANRGNTHKVFTLFVAVAMLEQLETLDAAAHMFDKDSVF
jgi:hypothetical protein